MEEILNLFDPQSGYKNWLTFLKEQKKKQIYRNIIPVILVNTEDIQLEKSLSSQVKGLSKEFTKKAYRNNLADDGCYDDMVIHC